jgi:hypothetical protein
MEPACDCYLVRKKNFSWIRIKIRVRNLITDPDPDPDRIIIPDMQIVPIGPDPDPKSTNLADIDFLWTKKSGVGHRQYILKACWIKIRIRKIISNPQRCCSFFYIENMSIFSSSYILP